MRNILLGLITAFAIDSPTFAQETPWAEKLFDGKLTHDFGKVKRGEQLKHTFKITNLTDTPVEITKVRMSCDCLKAEASPRILQPKDTGSVEVTINTGKFAGPKTVRIYVSFGAKSTSIATLTVSANSGGGDVGLTPAALDFGNLQRGQTPSRFIDVEYAGNSPTWKVNEIVPNSSAPFSLKVEALPAPADGKPRKGFRIVATMKPNAAVASFKQEVLLRINEPAKTALTFEIVGNVQDRLAISPDSISFNGKVGEAQAKKIFLRAPRPFRILSVDGLGDGLKIDLPKGEESTHVLTVNLTPAKAGTLRRQLTIRTDLDGESAQLTVEAKIEP